MRILLSLGILFCICLVSCHFNDDRLKVKNEGKTELLFAVSTLNPKERTDILSPFFSVEPGQSRIIYLLRNLNYGFMDIDSVSILQISPEIESSVLRKNGYYEYEQILKDKSYSHLNIATKDIVDNGGIEILFPSNRFRIPVH